MNFQFADRCHAVNYAAAIEKKIRYLNKYTNNGTEFFSTNIRFPIHTVYPLLVDFYHLIDDYLKVKDKYLYSKLSAISALITQIECSKPLITELEIFAIIAFIWSKSKLKSYRPALFKDKGNDWSKSEHSIFVQCLMSK